MDSVPHERSGRSLVDSQRLPGIVRLSMAKLGICTVTPTVVIHECRRCGSSLPSAEATCPYCRETTVATYVIE